MHRYLLLATLLISCELAICQAVEPGPEVIATKGGVWPMPKNIKTSPLTVTLVAEFKYHVLGHSCSILENALDRYAKLLFDFYEYKKKYSEKEQLLEFLDVKLKTPCDDHMRIIEGSDESYELKIQSEPKPESVLTANTIWGILRGLETFSQLIYKENVKLLMNCTTIEDEPRFTHRGLMLDTSRHFIPINKITKILDGMVYNKFNVFHWHIIDDHAFPYESEKFPELSHKGAYDPFFLIYTNSDIKDIVEYARIRGIRVIVEVDTPGHTRSWGQSHPEFLSKCIVDGEWLGQYGPFDPTNVTLYYFLQELFEEMFKLFPDEYFHIGADEVDYSCWKHHEHIENFIKDNKLVNFPGLEYYYFQQLFKSIEGNNRKFIAWEELFHTNGHRFENMTYQTWIGDGYKAAEKITKAGHKVIFSSSSWYLSQLLTGGDWKKLYFTDPHYIAGTDHQKDLIIGGEVCMWSENVDSTNVLTRIWPRASAVAEKLWSPMEVEYYEDAATRLEEHACRMIKRGIPTQPPNGPGFCL